MNHAKRLAKSTHCLLDLAPSAGAKIANLQGSRLPYGNLQYTSLSAHQAYASWLWLVSFGYHWEVRSSYAISRLSHGSLAYSSCRHSFPRPMLAGSYHIFQYSPSPTFTTSSGLPSRLTPCQFSATSLSVNLSKISSAFPTSSLSAPSKKTECRSKSMRLGKSTAAECLPPEVRVTSSSRGTM